MGILSQTIRLGFFFALLFTAYTSYQNIITQVYQQLNLPKLGRANLFMIYGGFMILNLVAPRIAKYITFKTMIIISTICYIINLSSGLAISFITNKTIAQVIVLFAGALSGSGSSMLWVAQGGYMHKICEDAGQQQNKGYYFGLFYGMYSASGITGGLVSTFILGYLSIRMYFIVITCIGCASLLFCLFFLPDIQSTEKASRVLSYEKKKDSVNLQSVPVLEDQQDIISLKESVFNIFRYYKEMKYMLPSIGLVGMIICFYSSVLHELVQLSMPINSTRSQVSMRTGLAFIVLGVGQIVASYSIGYISDRLRIKKSGGIALFTFFVACATSFLSYEYNDPILIMFVAFMWGFTYSAIQNWILLICSRCFSGSLESFAINKQFHSLTFCLMEIILILANPPLKLVLPAMILFGAICIISLPFVREESHISDED